jgi:Holliday junction resolvase
MFLLSIILLSYVYQTVAKRKYNKVYIHDEALLNITRFIIISGIVAFLIVKIIGFLLPGFD